MLARRVGDGVIRRVIGKWLKAGVLEGAQLSHPERGIPQGGVISPLLANIYLHEVLDAWFEEEVQPRLKGRSFIVRYADDAVLGFANKEDAERVYAVLAERFAKYALTLHPEKTRLLPFTRPHSNDRPRGGSRDQAVVRLSRLYAVLGTIQKRSLGGSTQNGEGPIKPGAA